MDSTKAHATPREGFTTGSAASGAAKAALTILLSGTVMQQAAVLPPPFDGVFAPKQRLHIPISFCVMDKKNTISVGYAGVIKDGGDDPDATNGMLITATVALAPFPRGTPKLAIGQGVYLYGGPGIGRATLPGLPIAVGEIAINPAPRKQIAAALAETAAALGFSGKIYCLLSAPEGEKRARKTLNSRLGIVGGISILGTSGTVKAFSSDAWKATIMQGLTVAKAVGEHTVCFTTGRRSERALQALLPELSPQAFIQVADFAGFAMQAAARTGFSHIVWACFPGKLLKLAQGLYWTHARSAEPDFMLLKHILEESGAPKDLAAQAVGLPTVTGAFDYAENRCPGISPPVLRRMCALALGNMRNMISGYPGKMEIRLYAFDMQGRLLATSESGSNLQSP